MQHDNYIISMQPLAQLNTHLSWFMLMEDFCLFFFLSALALSFTEAASPKKTQLSNTITTCNLFPSLLHFQTALTHNLSRAEFLGSRLSHHNERVHLQQLPLLHALVDKVCRHHRHPPFASHPALVGVLGLLHIVDNKVGGLERGEGGKKEGEGEGRREEREGETGWLGSWVGGLLPSL